MPSLLRSSRTSRTEPHRIEPHRIGRGIALGVAATLAGLTGPALIPAAAAAAVPRPATAAGPAGTHLLATTQVHAGAMAGSGTPAGAGSAYLSKVDPPVLTRVAGSDSAIASFFVLLKDHPALGAAAPTAARAERVGRVVRTERSHAETSQAPIRNLLATRKVAYTPFWIANAIRVTGNKQLITDLARRSDVEKIVADRTYPLIRPVATRAATGTGAGVEWNVDQIGAPKVWNAFDDRGGGVVVGTIDTGAQFDHPAIARQYRGASPGGSAPSQDHNWFDPTGACGGPADPPCDDVGHGTHVLGTILGDDGQSNQIGVAPGARWIAAKACGGYGCPLSALLAAGQWMLAPTNSKGEDPRPDLAPDVINNSWGGGPGDPFYQQVVDAWAAAGIVPVFAAGNSGPNCDTAVSPGDYTDSVAVGALDRDNVVAPFSSRGPGMGAAVKPDLSAPGVDIRSSVSGGGYQLLSGTSMAAPHVTGTIALALSAAPALRGDISALEDLLAGTTVPMPGPSCGGTEADNNVTGHGRLDAFMAVSKAPRGPLGGVDGTVLADGQPVAGARIEVDDVIPRTTTTDAQGRYSLRTLPIGDATATVTAFGYLSRTAAVVTDAGATITQDFDLAPAPRFTLSGHVTSEADGTPVPGASVRLARVPLTPFGTDVTGAYRVPDVPAGTYDLVFQGGNCVQPEHRTLSIASNTTLDVALPAKSDGLGHTCTTASATWVEAGTVLPLTGDDFASSLPLPFPLEFDGTTYSTVNVVTNGYLSFSPGRAFFTNVPIPTGGDLGAAIFPFWDDLNVDSEASVRTELIGTAPARRFVIEWSNVSFFDTPDLRVSFEVIISENGTITLQYRGAGNQPRTAGSSATVGLQNDGGTGWIQYSYDAPALDDRIAIVFARS